MGLTIHYKFEFKNDKQTLEHKLIELRNKFMDLPVRMVHEIEYIDKCQQEFGYGRYDDNRFYQNELGFELQYSFRQLRKERSKLNKIVEKIGGTVNLYKLSSGEYQTYKTLEYDIQRADKCLKSRILKYGNGYILPVDVGEGCEWFSLTIGRIGSSKLWRGGGCTKTQYAEDFVKSHLSVIKMLDLCKEAGLLSQVHDEGEYWETRNIVVLAKEINSSTTRLKSLFGALKEIVQEPLKVESKIDTCENYVNVNKDNIH